MPKDGPSAGVTLTTALISCLSGIPVRGDVAMTGEITLHGNVLPIGGLREKSMAAYREGMKTVLIPRGRKNEENFVLVSVNGWNFKIMKGVEVQVPEFVAQVLENARMMEDDARSYVDRMAN